MVKSALQEELRKKKPFDCPEQEAHLNLVRTADFLARPFAELMGGHDISGPQYNVLRILRGHGDAGLPSQEITAQMTGVRLITTDPSFYAQVQALGVYDPSRAPQGTGLLVDRITHGGSLNVRAAAAERLSLKPDEAGLAALESMTRVEEPRNIRGEALGLLADWPDKTRAIAVATRYLNDGDPLFAINAVRTLAQIGEDAGRTTLTAALARETRVTVRAAITRALASK